MIIVLFGQPNCGKSTLANALLEESFMFVNIDGDKLREIFVNKDYSREGRMKNLNRASDIAVFLSSIGDDVIVSMVYPYKEARDYLNNLCDSVYWVHLTYDGQRGREAYHVADFEEPSDDEKVLKLNTSTTSVEDCVTKIMSYAKVFG